MHTRSCNWLSVSAQLTDVERPCFQMKEGLDWWIGWLCVNLLLPSRDVNDFATVKDHRPWNYVTTY